MTPECIFDFPGVFYAPSRCSHEIYRRVFTKAVKNIEKTHTEEKQFGLIIHNEWRVFFFHAATVYQCSFQDFAVIRDDYKTCFNIDKC